MQPLLTSEQMRAVDQAAIKEFEIPELILMEHAALAVFERLQARFGRLLKDTRACILAGTGNNGGDALAVARLLKQAGATQIVVALITEKKLESAKLSHSCAKQVAILSRLGIACVTDVSAEVLATSDFIVDGILGTGLSRPLGKKLSRVIEQVNASGKWIVSIDLPTGLNSDTGTVDGTAIRASETVSLGFLKKGLVTGRAADYVGVLTCAPIQIPREVPFVVDTLLYEKSDAARLPHRRAASHKGDFGRVYVWAGGADREGAAVLSTLAALRCGAGLVTVVSESKDIRHRLPAEAMVTEATDEFFASAPMGVVVLGPGLGTEEKHWALIQKALVSKWPLVLDADALTLLGANRESTIDLLKIRTAVTILTPHPKEASRLLGTLTTDQIESDRYHAIQTLTETFLCHVLLKGKGTLTRAPHGPTLVITRGDSGLSKGGSGDLLSGVLAALVAQALAPEQALSLASYLHGRASELLTQRRGQSRSSLASEIADELIVALGELEKR